MKPNRLAQGLALALTACIIGYALSRPIASLWGEKAGLAAHILLGMPLGWLFGGGVPRILQFPGLRPMAFLTGLLVSIAVTAATIVLGVQLAHLIADFLAAGLKIIAALMVLGAAALMCQGTGMTSGIGLILVAGLVIFSIPAATLVGILAFLVNYIWGSLVREL